ncbi:hypothetical protein ACGFX4_34205 [Kitasatospora sp. NPDC048365]|uniref:hypothetical protein n=1 Tax=Kitasatospora sp. NPDC048365 TaxID=3364050 RepID=UPI0037113AF3
MLLPPEQTLFVRGTVPALLLAAAPVHDDLPVLAVADGEVPHCEGWSIVPKLTLCVVDGPGDAGIVIPAMVAPVVDGHQGLPADLADWCEDAERAGGAVVLSLDALPESLDWTHLLRSGTSRGGFLPALT